jgi:hypothetical protein
MINGQVVTAKNYQDKTFKIVDISKGGSATIREFNVSRQSLGELVLTMAIKDLNPFKEDASKAAVRVAREATEA